MNDKTNLRTAAMAIIILILVLTGCASPATSDRPGQAVDSQATAKQEASPSPEPAAKEKEEQKNRKDLTISSPADEANAKASASPEQKTEPAKLPNYNVTEPFDVAKPTLMGFTVLDPIEGVTNRFGKPSSETSMKDGLQSIQVLEYPGFSFGADENKSILFIEVTSDQINPGLNQFRVGLTVDEAQKLLGPADSLNDYVMIYETDGLVLKCDLNPHTKEVVSIKLFAS